MRPARSASPHRLDRRPHGGGTPTCAARPETAQSAHAVAPQLRFRSRGLRGCDGLIVGALPVEKHSCPSATGLRWRSRPHLCAGRTPPGALSPQQTLSPQYRRHSAYRLTGAARQAESRDVISPRPHHDR
ncbi:hypothetical protein BJY14_007843 [Actinomadura luteofluorescens]|uniref:Uncharacterized protein n=1 Tax=Actinomadura luteofluorescens TaxID=46163 RepID=A0A7Y9ERN5_9ACTN|nr:hypothetical protein [Actinomadura luteofluorescens]